MTCINAFLSLFLKHNMRTHRSFSDNAVSFFKLVLEASSSFLGMALVLE